jgi:hypothetical protein
MQPRRTDASSLLRVEPHRPRWYNRCTVARELPITPLDAWIRPPPGRRNAGGRLLRRNSSTGGPEQPGDGTGESVAHSRPHAAANAPFYRKCLRGLEDAPLRELPFTFPIDARRSGIPLSHGLATAIRRVITLTTSEPRHQRKRLHFTAEDLNATEEFFFRGMTTFTPPGSNRGVLMGEPARRNRRLLERALRRMNCSVHVFPSERAPSETAARMDEVLPLVMGGSPLERRNNNALHAHAPQSSLLSGDMLRPRCDGASRHGGMPRLRSLRTSPNPDGCPWNAPPVKGVTCGNSIYYRKSWMRMVTLFHRESGGK